MELSDVLHTLAAVCVVLSIVQQQVCRNAADERRAYLLSLLYVALLSWDQLIDWWHGRWRLEDHMTVYWLAHAGVTACAVAGWLWATGRLALTWCDRRLAKRWRQAAASQES